MKQGRAGSDRMSGGKVEPRPHAISLDKVARMGTMQGPGTKDTPLYKSDGYKAPMAGSTIHHSGTQGKHK